MEALKLDLESCKPKRNQLAIGMQYGGGIILDLDETGRHGLIVALEDIGFAPWGCMGVGVSDATEMQFDGALATKAILAACPEKNIAARLCARYTAPDQYNPQKKYKDWFFPSISQVRLIAQNLPHETSMCGHNYLTSSQAGPIWMGAPLDATMHAYTISLACATTPDGDRIAGTFSMPIDKNLPLRIRPMRNF